VKNFLLLIALTFLTFNISCKKNPTSSPNTAPIASFAITPSSGGTTSTVFTFNASGSIDNEDATTVLEVRWDWNNDGTYDTNYSTSKTATHQYSLLGTHTVKLEVKDSGELTTTATKTISLSNTAPTATFTVDPTSGFLATVFNFDASGCTDNEDATTVLEVRWDWNDDGTYDTNYSTSKTATHQYTTAGTYTAKLEVKDTGGLTNTTTRQVTVTNVVFETGTVTDIDGNVYITVKIGNQWWMAENLKVTNYRNGNAIANIIDNTQWFNLTTGAYCSYNNDDNNISTYGLLYNWFAVVDAREISPAGWHVPTDGEWDTLVNYLGGNSIAGGKLKEAGTIHWSSPNTGATNESGFSAFPGGSRNDSGAFYSGGGLSVSAYFWSSKEQINSPYAIYRNLQYTNPSISRNSNKKQFGLSVRCIKD